MRRGAALLVVLGTLVIVVSASVAMARIASTAAAQRRADLRTTMADALLIAAELPIRAWLAEQAAEVVLAPDAVSPRVDVLADAWTIDTTAFSLRIVAFDQCGMVPYDSATLRGALPGTVRSVVDRLRVRAGEPAGLDLFVPLVTRDELRVFPGDDDEASAIGELIATHNRGLINVNTVPIPVLERAIRQAGRGGLDQIIAAREEGEPFNPATGQPPPDPRRRPRSVELTGRSDAWAFLVEVHVGRAEGAAVVRRWWAVYQEHDSKWECVQRLADTT